ncbi:uncharacterized mitochondrial protein AtMg00300-like [Lathyrus oleraceus]|uniref:uncharacterized mitochondrial protein AtMg00300-like n=1 Tax=Pisum sativum TaxID=3888 RepID=UPI0021CF72E8|nr:uncharacterized mitochondrial protein AtMg00300-like [Pisum sativum]
MKGSKEVLRGMKKQGLYTLEAEVVSGYTDVASMKPLSKTKVWHMISGHVSERGLVELGNQNLLGGDKVEKLKFCELCVLGKSCRVKFNRGKQRTYGSLDYIHVDLGGLKIDEAIRSEHIFEEELEHEKIPVEVEHIDVELHIPNQVEEEA